MCFFSAMFPALIFSLPGRNGSIYGSGVMLSLSTTCFLTTLSETDKSIERRECSLDTVQPLHRVTLTQKWEPEAQKWCDHIMVPSFTQLFTDLEWIGPVPASQPRWMISEIRTCWCPKQWLTFPLYHTSRLFKMVLMKLIAGCDYNRHNRLC